MDFTPDEIKRFEARRMAEYSASQPATPIAQAPKRSGLASWLPAIGGTIGSIGGGLIGGAGGFFGGAGVGAVPGAAVGAGVGGAAGGALGEWLAQKLSGESKDGYDKGNIVQEGVTNGILGALPIGKIGQLGKGLLKGAGERVIAKGGEEIAGQLLKEGGERVVKKGAETVAADTAGGIRKWLGNKLISEADNRALSATQLAGKKEALKGFEKRFGEDLGSYIRKNDLIGKTGQDVEDKVISKLNKKYASIVNKIDTPITSSDVLAQNMKKGSSLEKLLRSGSSENKQLADDVFAELDHIFKNEGGSITPQRLAELKSEYQNLARNSYKLGANSKASVNEKVAEYLKKTLQGVSGSDELKTVGKEIDKAYKAADLLASASQNGRGTLNFGLTDSVMAGGGFAGGGVPGAVAAVAGKRAFNSPQVQSFLAKKLAQGGESLLANGGEKVVQNIAGDGAKQLIKGQIPGRTIQALGVAGGAATPTTSGSMTLDPTSPFNPTSPNYNKQAVDPSAMGDPYSISSIMGDNQSPYPMQNMQADIMRDPAHADQYAKLYDLMNPKGSDAGTLQLSDAAIARTTDAQKALSGLDELDAILADGYAGGKIAGNVRKLNPFDSTFKTQKASIARIKQIVGKALEGGVLRKEDEAKYAEILPTMQDDPTVYRAKVAKLRSMIQNDMQSYLQMQQVYGKGAGQTTGTDIQSLMASGY